jgi:hypothetical protein
MRRSAAAVGDEAAAPALHNRRRNEPLNCDGCGLDDLRVGRQTSAIRGVLPALRAETAIAVGSGLAVVAALGGMQRQMRDACFLCEKQQQNQQPMKTSLAHKSRLARLPGPAQSKFRQARAPALFRGSL